MSLKLRVYGILEPGDDDSKYFDLFIIGLISLLFGGIGFRSSLDPFKYIHIAFCTQIDTLIHWFWISNWYCYSQ